MKLLELFAGSRSFCKVAEQHGWETFSTDIEPFENIDYVVDILEFDVNKVPWVPDVIWASSECQGFSVAAISHNWTGGKEAYIPKSDRAKLGIKLAKKTIEIIEHFKKLNPNLIWYMENPRGVMRKMPFMEALPIRNSVTYCFAGETEIITKYGRIPIKDAVGEQELLMPDGTWKICPIRSFGQSQLMELKVRRAGVDKIIRVTPNHLWYVKQAHRTWLTTTDSLKKGDQLPTVNPSVKNDFVMDTTSIARGFVYGDGSSTSTVLANGDRKRYHSRAQFCGKKDQEMVKYFDGHGTSRGLNKGHLNIHGLPLEWKMEIPKQGSISELTGWLAGYIAADGSVGKNGQVVIHSSKKENLEAFRDICQMVGIRTYEINYVERIGFGKLSKLYSLGLIRSTLKPEFFLMSHHRANFFQPSFEPVWRVVSVKHIDAVEEVFCATVDGYEAFAIEGNILTHNCSYKDTRMKPSDVWTNNDMWSPRKMCKNGGHGTAVIDGKTWCLNEHGKPCHESAPRGAKTGTQGLKGDYERSKVPAELCDELVRASELYKAYHGNERTPMSPEHAASLLNARLREHSWFFSAGVGESEGEPCLILFLKKDLSELERTMLPEFCEGYRVIAKVMGTVVPAQIEASETK